MAEVETPAVPISALDENYSRFRLAHPAGEAKVLESVRAFGQILPVVAVRGHELTAMSRSTVSSAFRPVVSWD